MEILKQIFPSIFGESEMAFFASMLVQIIMFVILIIAMAKIIKNYFELSELKSKEKDSENLQEGIERMMHNIEVLKKVFLIVFIILIAIRFISSILQ